MPQNQVFEVGANGLCISLAGESIVEQFVVVTPDLNRFITTEVRQRFSDFTQRSCELLLGKHSLQTVRGDIFSRYTGACLLSICSTEKHQHTEQRSRDVSTGRHPLKFDGVANNNGHRTHQNREVSKT